MYTIQNYKRVKSLEEAFELNKKRSSAVIGGGMWLRLGKRTIGTAIDLSDLGLDRIEETEDAFILGCMTTLRDIECHEGLNRYFHGYMKETMRGIVGTQFRNTATIGGSIYQRFGFSDPLTALLALDTTVELYGRGMVSLDDYVKEIYDRDILVKIHIKKDGRKVAYQSFRNTKTDFPVLAVAVSNINTQWKVCVGARPFKAKTANPELVLSVNPEKDEIKSFSRSVADCLRFDSNMRASGAYRKVLCEVLVERAIHDILAQRK